MNCLVPLSTQPSPSRARGRAHRRGVAAGAGLGQAPGAERLARAPAARGTSASARRCRTSTDAPAHRPLCAATDSATTDRRAPALRCRCSSRPPTCRRRRTSREPGCPSARARPACGSSSAGNACASSHSMTCGRISASANSRTVRRSSSCSGVERRSIRKLYHWRSRLRIASLADSETDTGVMTRRLPFLVLRPVRGPPAGPRRPGPTRPRSGASATRRPRARPKALPSA